MRAVLPSHGTLGWWLRFIYTRNKDHHNNSCSGGCAVVKWYQKALPPYCYYYMYHTYSDKKPSQVERVQRTIRQRLGRVFTLNSNNKWIDIIDDVINSYNNSFHRSIKMKPVDVKMEHVAILRHRLNYNGNTKPAKFKVGHKVRIIKKKKRFENEYKPSWTDEIFIINKLNPTNPITYMLIDNNGENIIGSFYHEELQHVN